MSTDMRTDMIDFCDSKLGLRGYKDYIDDNLGEAIDVIKHGGSMIDLDIIVQLKKLLDMNISYDLYSYLDNIYDEDMMEISQCENMKEELSRHICNYLMI